jgi:hypothetical protein
MKNMMIGLTLVVSSVAVAQPARNQVEKAKDRQDIRQNTRQIADDKRDLANVNTLLTQFDAAVARSDVAAIAAVDSQFQAYLVREGVEAQREVAQANQEVREGKREVRSEARELKRDVVQGRPVAALDSAKDLVRDQGNLADDRSDAAKERAARNRLFAIRTELTPLQGLADPASTSKKRALYAETVQLAQRDLARTQVEQREDRRELREDRRETREDRRDLKR